jgi:hypothetical protein
VRARNTSLSLVCLVCGCLPLLRAASNPLIPSFFAREDYPLSSNWVSIGDVNGDGIPDLIGIEEGITHVYFGNGDGTFRVGPIQSTQAGGGYDAVVGDINGDGKADLIMAGGPPASQVGGLLVCLGNGDGTFQNAVFYPQGSDSFRKEGLIAVADFTGDGILDVAAVGASGVWLFTGRGDGTFNAGVVAVPLGPGGFGIAAADFNGDGKQDLVVTMPETILSNGHLGDGFFLILGNGNGTFQTPQGFLAPIQFGEVAAGSLGASHQPGIALGLFGTSGVAVLFGDGKGGFSKPEYIALSAMNFALGIADVNGDGIGDIVAVDSAASIALGTAANTFAQPVSYTVAGGGTFNLALGDLRNNGLTDIVVDTAFAISVLLNTGKGKYEDGIFTSLSVGAGCGVTGDFNRDGKPDVAVNTSSGIQILLGTGIATVPLKVGQSLTGVADAGCMKHAGDLNGDGILDLAITSSTGVISFLGNGDGTFTEKSTTATASGPPYMVLADFNHDGKLDFATAGNQLALGNGDGTFQTPVNIVPNPPAQGFNNIAEGDINNDGWPDIILTNSDEPTTNLYVLLNNHKGGFTQVPANFGAGGTEAILADLNGDGNLDLVLNGDVYLGNGKGKFTLSELLNPGFEVDYPPPEMVADVNGDGIPDVALLVGDIAVFLGLGDGTFAAPFFLGQGPSPGSIFSANLHGQKSAAGLPDLVLPDTTGGVLVLINETK